MMAKLHCTALASHVSLALVALMLMQLPPSARAQDPISVGLVALGAKLLVGDILNDFEEKTESLIDRAGQRGELVVAHAGSELQLTIANLKVMLGEQQKQAFENLSEQQRKAFHNLNKTLDRVQQMIGEVRPMSELISLDVRMSVERLRGAFRAEEQDFYISSIRGTTLTYQDQEYRVVVSGLGIGFPGNEPKCVVDVILDGEELNPFGSFKQEENNRLEVKLPAKQLQPKFKEDKLATAKFAIRSTITKNGKSRTYEVGVPLVLLPLSAGEIEIEEVTESKKWSTVKETKTITLSRKAEGEQMTRVEEWRCADNQKIVDIRYECNDPNAGFCYPIRHQTIGDPRGYGADAEIVEGGKKAVVYRKLGTVPVTCHYHIDFVTEQVAYDKINKGKVRLKFDEPFEIDLSSSNKDGNFKIAGRLVNGQKLLLTSGIGDSDKDNPLKLIGREKSSDHYKLTFKLGKLP